VPNEGLQVRYEYNFYIVLFKCDPTKYRRVLLVSTLLHAFMNSQHLLNVLVHIANKAGGKKKTKIWPAFQLKYKREFCRVSGWQFLKIPVCDNRNTVRV
jgi:hypothetical protein